MINVCITQLNYSLTLSLSLDYIGGTECRNTIHEMGCKEDGKTIQSDPKMLQSSLTKTQIKYWERLSKFAQGYSWSNNSLSLISSRSKKKNKGPKMKILLVLENLTLSSFSFNPSHDPPLKI